MGDSVGDCPEPGRERDMEFFEHLVFQDLGMQIRHAVDAERTDDRQMRHPHLAMGNDRHFGNPLPIFRV